MAPPNPMTINPVHTATKAEAAYETLRDAIRSGTLAPGQRVTLKELAENLGMSLTPVREALGRLAEHGLVEQTPNHGTFVAQFTKERAEEIYRLRLVLEPLATQLCARKLSDTAATEIEDAMLAVEQAVEEGRTADVAPLNASFHSAIYNVADSTYLNEFIDRLWNGVPFQAISLADRHSESCSEHRLIYEAIIEHKEDEAADAMRRHIQAGADAVLQRFASYFPSASSSRLSGSDSSSLES